MERRPHFKRWAGKKHSGTEIFVQKAIIVALFSTPPDFAENFHWKKAGLRRKDESCQDSASNGGLLAFASKMTLLGRSHFPGHLLPEHIRYGFVTLPKIKSGLEKRFATRGKMYKFYNFIIFPKAAKPKKFEPGKFLASSQMPVNFFF